MRHSSLRHPLAVLRKIIGMNQDEFAAFSQFTGSSIRSIECGPARMKLSERFSEKVSVLTGVSQQWLLEGNPAAAPVARDGTPYTAKTWEKVRNGARIEPAEDTIFDILARIADKLTTAKQQGRLMSVAWKVERELRNV